MAKKKVNPKVPGESIPVPKGDDDALPLSLYSSIVGTHSLLLLFAMVVLPRSTLAFEELPPQASSADRPQSEFLAPITAWPAMSIAWMCIGVAMVQSFWAARAVGWVKADILKTTGVAPDEARLVEGDHTMRVSI